MLLHCDRCHGKFEGDESREWSYGWYDVSSGYWARYANLYETVICDACMWCDPRYIADYGDFQCKSVQK